MEECRQGWYGLAPETLQLGTAHQWSARETETWTGTKLALGAAKEQLLAYRKGAIWSKFSCNTELETEEERAKV